MKGIRVFLLTLYTWCCEVTHVLNSDIIGSSIHYVSRSWRKNLSIGFKAKFSKLCRQRFCWKSSFLRPGRVWPLIYLKTKRYNLLQYHHQYMWQILDSFWQQIHNWSLHLVIQWLWLILRETGLFSMAYFFIFSCIGSTHKRLVHLGGILH